MENEEKEKGKIEEGKKDIKESKTYRSDEVEKKKVSLTVLSSIIQINSNQIAIASDDNIIKIYYIE